MAEARRATEKNPLVFFMKLRAFSVWFRVIIPDLYSYEG